MRGVAFLVVMASFAGGVWAQAPASQPADPLAETHRIEDAVIKLWEKFPDSGAIDALLAKQRKIRAQAEDESRALQDQIDKLEETEAYREYLSRRQELEEQLPTKWSAELNAMKELAKRIYTARHEELGKLAPAVIAEGRDLGFDVLSFPRLDGSTSTRPLNVIVASRLLNVPYQWRYPEPTGSPWARWGNSPGEVYLPTHEYNLGYGDNRDIEFTLSGAEILAAPPDRAPSSQLRVAAMINSLLADGTNTHEAYLHLVEGKCDLNINARGPSEDELKLAKERGVKIGLKAIAKDALVFIVHRNNPLKSLTLQQIRDIYQDKLTLWKDVGVNPEVLRGGPDSEVKPGIFALRRERDSGSRELFDSLIIAIPDPRQGEKNYGRWDRLYTSTMAGPFNQITERSNAVGYSVYYYEHFMALSPYTRTIAIEGVEPSPETIASGKYPLVAPVYAAYRESDAADSPGMKLLNWLLSEEGQKVVKESGYVPVK